MFDINILERLLTSKESTKLAIVGATASSRSRKEKIQTVTNECERSFVKKEIGNVNDESATG